MKPMQHCIDHSIRPLQGRHVTGVSKITHCASGKRCAISLLRASGVTWSSRPHSTSAGTEGHVAGSGCRAGPLRPVVVWQSLRLPR
jgi:hypothetical protein